MIDAAPTRLFHNPRAGKLLAYGSELDAILSAEGFAAARAEIASWPGYRTTPLVALDGIARAAGVTRLWYKDEAWRFDLKSFKALGGAYAVLRLLQREVARHGGPQDVASAELAAGRWEEVTRQVTVTCATDGNHGRSVAWGAKLFRCRAVIFVPGNVSAGRRAAISRFGAEVIAVPGNYDDAVRHAAAEAARNGWTVVSDTSYPGYTEIPRDVMHGYGVVAEETIRQLGGEIPTHVFVQAGVGGLAAAICARFWQHWAARRPRFVVVEPERADCCFRSAVAGKPAASEGDLETVMAGLSCGEVSLLAWPILASGADDFMTIDDAWALHAVRLLAEGRHGDRKMVGGETGVAGLAAFDAAIADPAIRVALALGPESRILVIGSEGDTDPEIYRRITGRTAAEIRAAP